MAGGILDKQNCKSFFHRFNPVHDPTQNEARHNYGKQED